MKLNELHIAQQRACAITKSETIASRNGRIRRLAIHLSRSAGGNQSGARYGFKQFSVT